MARDMRALWVEVITRRRALHLQADEASMELLEPADPDWITALGDAFEAVRVAREEPRCTVDPRDALIDVLAVTTAWIDAMDGRTPHAGPARPGTTPSTHPLTH